MRRLAVTTVVLCAIVVTPALAQDASRASAPSLGIKLRLGAATTDRVCWLYSRFDGVGPDGAPFAGSATRSLDACRTIPPLRVDRAKRLTITLRDPASAIGATWYAGNANATIPVQPAGGQAPAPTWILSVPSVSGRLALGVSYPPRPAPQGGVWQFRTDYRVVVRRPATASKRPPRSAEPVPPQIYDDRG